MERVCQYFLEDKVLGFDLEWSPLGPPLHPSPSSVDHTAALET
ncbi:3 -5 exonuclease helicase [Colletotrichum plurivorum]|uniref:3 -5 exonuclease helicase n=1 Tax=Colletotrichum plurivorum TaxID=2175906 RepID=A0A8H6KVD9_9PEZI|nr:3 -5 exonuclease helicase [Colletotrichum plurivorum]